VIEGAAPGIEQACQRPVAPAETQPLADAFMSKSQCVTTLFCGCKPVATVSTKSIVMMRVD
jgi:hypothetical protein